MNLQEIIEEMRTCFERIDSALEQSDNPTGKREEWLLCVLALLSKDNDANNDNTKKTLSNPNGYRQKAFKNAVSRVLDAIKNGKSEEEFFAEISDGSKSYTLNGIKHLVKNYCIFEKAEWSDIESALTANDSTALNGYIKDFVDIIIDSKNDFRNNMEAYYSKSCSESDWKNWYYVVFATYLSSPEAVSSFISDVLGKYFDRWHIDGTDEYFPYSMDKTSHVKGQTGDDWKALKQRINELEEEYLKEIKVDRYAYYNGKHYKVSNTAYDAKGNKSSTGQCFKLGTFKKLFDTENAEEVNSWYRKPDDSKEIYEETFDVQHYSSTSTYSNIIGGKGSPEIMNYVYSKLKKENKISGRDDFVKYGLGIDCSGFVSRAILDLMITLKIPVYTQFKTIGHGYGRLKTNASTLRSEGSELLYLYRPDDSKSKKLPEDPKPDYQDYLKPGDIIMRKEIIPEGNGEKYKETERPFHILIIKDVTEDSFEVWNSKSLNSEGPRCDTYSSVKEFLKLQDYSIKKSGGHELIVDFRRPNILCDLNKLIPYFIEYLEGGDQ